MKCDEPLQSALVRWLQSAECSEYCDATSYWALSAQYTLHAGDEWPLSVVADREPWTAEK